MRGEHKQSQEDPTSQLMVKTSCIMWVSTLFVRLQHWPCSLSLLQAHNTIANTGFHTPAFDTSTRSEKITTLWSLNRRRLRVIHKREAPSSKYLLFAAGNSCVCVHFPALPCQSHFKSVAFQASCQVQAASFAVFTRPCIFLVAQPPSVPTSLVLFYRAT